MSIHIGAKTGDIAETILLPGDPLRAKWIAETFLHNPVCFNKVRGMLGYTGTFKGKRVSVMGTGMGLPSISIYVHELITEYGVKKLIRVGSCGAIQEQLNLRDIIFALSASSISAFNIKRFNGSNYSPTVNFDLFSKAVNIANQKSIPFTAGNVLTNDFFYADNPDDYKKWADYGVLCLEMETAGLYTIAAKHNVKALSILTVSDSLITQEETTSKERETTFKDMINIALELA